MTPTPTPSPSPTLALTSSALAARAAHAASLQAAVLARCLARGSQRSTLAAFTAWRAAAWRLEATEWRSAALARDARGENQPPREVRGAPELARKSWGP